MSDITVGSVWTRKSNENRTATITQLSDDWVFFINRDEGYGDEGKDGMGLNTFVGLYETYARPATAEEDKELQDILNEGRKDDSAKPKHSHYHKNVSQYDTIDVYAVCKIFDVQDTSGCLQHAIKKLLVTGQRGHKDRQTDIQNAIDTLNRLLELESEAADD